MPKEKAKNWSSLKNLNNLKYAKKVEIYSMNKYSYLLPPPKDRFSVPELRSYKL
jgi:hypothetical protein